MYNNVVVEKSLYIIQQSPVNEINIVSFQYKYRLTNSTQGQARHLSWNSLF